MEVLRPALININGRMYRRNIIKEEHYEEEEEDVSYMGPPGNLGPVMCMYDFANSAASQQNYFINKKKPVIHLYMCVSRE